MDTAHTAPDCGRAKLGQKRTRAGVAVLALLIATATTPKALAQELTDGQFDAAVFHRDGTAAAARARLNSELSARLDEIDRGCGLTEAQRKKLQLSGRGDIHRFFDRCDSVKEKLRLAQDGGPKAHFVAVGAPQVFFGPDGRRVNVVENQRVFVLLDGKAMQDVLPLQRALQVGLFQPDSLLYKSLPRTLTPEQFALWASLRRSGLVPDKGAKARPSRPAAPKK